MLNWYCRVLTGNQRIWGFDETSGFKLATNVFKKDFWGLRTKTPEISVFWITRNPENLNVSLYINLSPCHWLSTSGLEPCTITFIVHILFKWMLFFFWSWIYNFLNGLKSWKKGEGTNKSFEMQTSPTLNWHMNCNSCSSDSRQKKHYKEEQGMSDQYPNWDSARVCIALNAEMYITHHLHWHVYSLFAKARTWIMITSCKTQLKMST